MIYKNILLLVICVTLWLPVTQSAFAQQGMDPGGFDDRGGMLGRMGGFGGRGGGMRGGRGGGRGGMGGMNQTTELVKTYDKDKNGWLNSEERKAARQAVSGRQMGGFGRGGGMGMGGFQTAASTGPKLTPADVNTYPEKVSLYDLTALRTIFLDFEESDWESELEDFYHTDVEVTARMTVDGKTYQNVGIRFRGNTSYQTSSRGQKRPLNITMDLAEKKQHLYGYRTLNLLTSNSDPTFTRQVLYSYIARQYIPALKANYVRLVINGESWGVYINYQQFNTDFIKDEFDTRKGARWKIPVNMGGGRGGMGSGGNSSGLAYLGDNAAAYKNLYEIKSNDDPNSWAALIHLCKVLNQTPTNQLEKALEPILDIEEALRFLAIDNALINNDGYWTRASDYLLYQDKDGRFHVIPYDTSETMSEIEGMAGGGMAGGVNLAPLSGSNDSGKPLLSKLLAVTSLRQKHLGYIRDIAENWLQWDKIRPLARQMQSLIEADIKTDNHKLGTTQAFINGLDQTSSGSGFGDGRGGFGGGRGGRGGFGGASMSLKSFVEQRSAYLLGLQQIKQVPLPKNTNK
jgi:spore coat protein CotH